MAARQMQNNQFPAPRITVQCFSQVREQQLIIASDINSVSGPHGDTGHSRSVLSESGLRTEPPGIEPRLIRHVDNVIRVITDIMMQYTIGR